MPRATAILDDDVGRRVRDQLDRVAANPAVARLCGEVYANNYVFILPHHGVDAESSATAIGTSTRGLNTADQLLLDWCDEVLADRTISAAHTTCSQWRTHVESGENLVGATFAIHAFHQLSQSLPLASLLAKERPDIVRVLQTTDPAVRDICRLNGFVPLRVVDNVTGLMLSELERTGALQAVERIEIAQDLGPEISGSATSAPQFPTLLVYLRPDASPQNVRVAVEVFTALTTTVARPGIPTAQFSVPVGTAATFSQGFRLFKHYLYPLGLLDTVYDAEWHHALTSLPADPPVANAVALRRLLAQ